VWDNIMEALAAVHDAAAQIVDTSIVRYDKLAANYLAFTKLASIRL
jgi:transposase